MSLTRLLTGERTRSEVRARLDQLLPKFERSHDVPVGVPASGEHAALVGTAFDYAARLELAHLAPHAISSPWVAEAAVARLKLVNSHALADAERVVQDARRLVRRNWCRSASKRHALIATHAARLAQLDTYYRSGHPPTFGEVDGIDEGAIADDVVQLLLHADPLWELSTRRPLLLNPDFGTMSGAVGGADADLVAHNTLIDIKTTKHAIIERDHMRQIVGYVALARACARKKRFAQVDTVAFYFARYGVLRSVRLSEHLTDADYVDAARFLASTWERVWGPHLETPVRKSRAGRSGPVKAGGNDARPRARPAAVGAR